MEDCKGRKRTSKINRRQLIKTTTLAGMGAAATAAGFGSVGASFSEPLASRLLLPLSFDSFVDLESFVRALGDSAVRAQLSGNPALPAAARELVAMVNDQAFVAMTNSVVAGCDQYIRGVISEESLMALGQKLKSYITSQYPAAFTALVSYAESAYPHYAGRIEDLRQRLNAVRAGALPCREENKEPQVEASNVLDGWFDVSFCVMANYLAVVNFGLYTNVALATFVAAALAVVAVLVIPVA